MCKDSDNNNNSTIITIKTLELHLEIGFITRRVFYNSSSVTIGNLPSGAE